MEEERGCNERECSSVESFKRGKGRRVDREVSLRPVVVSIEVKSCRSSPDSGIRYMREAVSIAAASRELVW